MTSIWIILVTDTARAAQLARGRKKLCELVRDSRHGRCPGATAAILPHAQSGLAEQAEFRLEQELFEYARENLLIANIYIKVGCLCASWPICQ